MDTKDAVSLCVSNELDLTFAVEVGLSTGVGAEGERSDAVFNTGGLDLGLVLANPGDFGVGVHDTWDGGVVDVAMALGDVFDGSNGFLLSLVGKHGTKSAVTNDTDVLGLGSVFLVDDESALVVNIDADVFESETSGVWSSTNGNENNVSFQGLLLSTLGSLNVQSNGTAAVVTADNLCAGHELDALLSKELLGLLGDLSVHAGTTDLAEEFDDGDFRAKSRPDGGLQQWSLVIVSTCKLNRWKTLYHLQTNDSTTNDNHLLWNFLQ